MIISDRPLYRVVPRIGVDGIFLLKTHIVVVNIHDYEKEARPSAWIRSEDCTNR